MRLVARDTFVTEPIHIFGLRSESVAFILPDCAHACRFQRFPFDELVRATCATIVSVYVRYRRSFTLVIEEES
jgi:hypothetical protein